ncbi:MAG: hypothetical protein AABX19_02000 [Nanoarchaeota archaeon]
MDRFDFVDLILNFSDVPDDKFVRARDISRVRVKNRVDNVGGVAEHEVYGITTDVISRYFPVRDALVNAISIDSLSKRLELRNSSNNNEDGERQLGSDNHQALVFLSEHLSAEETFYLTHLVNNGSSSLISNLTVDYVRKNLDMIIGQLRLVMKFHPLEHSSVFQLDMDSALEKSVIETYQDVRLGLSTFPRRFFKDNSRNARIITRFLLERELGMPADKANILTSYDFEERGLAHMLRTVYDDSPVKAVLDVYPNSFKHWEFSKVPRSYWAGDKGRDNARTATRWLVEEHLGLRTEQAIKVTREDFIRASLNPMLIISYRGCAVEALGDAYSQFKPWEFYRLPKEFWKRKDAIEKSKEAIKWYLEEMLDLSEEQLINVRARDFEGSTVRHLIKKLYDNSHLKAISDIYPGKFKIEGEGRSQKLVYIQ